MATELELAILQRIAQQMNDVTDKIGRHADREGELMRSVAVIQRDLEELDRLRKEVEQLRGMIHKIERDAERRAGSDRILAALPALTISLGGFLWTIFHK